MMRTVKLRYYGMAHRFSDDLRWPGFVLEMTEDSRQVKVSQIHGVLRFRGIALAPASSKCDGLPKDVTRPKFSGHLFCTSPFFHHFGRFFFQSP